MAASSGGIGIEYLERQPFRKIAWLSRMAEVYRLKRHLDLVYAVNTGYGGRQKDIEELQQRINFLSLTKPKTDVKKLAKHKRRMRAEARKPPKKKKKKKPPRKIKFKIKDK
jgi:hypothetical protein